MKKLLPVLVSLFLLSPQQALASINVEVSGNGPGSKSEVSVESNIKSSTKNDKSTNRTDIRIENNGEVEEFHGEGNVNVKLESGNGNNSVSIQNISPGVDITESTFSSSASVSGETKEEEIEAGFNIVEFIKKQFNLLFNIFLN